MAGLCAVGVAHAQQASGDEVGALPGVRPPAGTLDLTQATGATVDLAQAANAGDALTGASGASGAAGAATSGARWRVAPIRWGGEFGVDWRRASASQGFKHTQTSEFVNLRASSYIWQPWFAQVTSSLSLAAGRSHASGGLDDQASASGDSMRSVTGSFGASVFPLSRFPFAASYTSSDSRTSDVFTIADTRTQRLTLRQSYREASGINQFSGGFDRSTLTSASFGTDTVDALNASYTRRTDPHQFDVLAMHNRNTRSSDSGGARSTRLSLTHSYRGDEDWQVGSMLSDASTSVRAVGAGTSLSSKIGFRQLNSVATWNPDTEQPLIATGAFRWAESSSESQTGEGSTSRSSTRALSATGSASWRATKQLNVSGSASLSQFAFGDTTQTTMSESVSAVYAFDPLTFAGFTYLPTANASLGHQAGGFLGSRLQAAAGFNHALNRAWTVSDRTSISSSLSQGLSTRTESTAGATQSLTHNASLTGRHMTDGGMNGYAGLSLADSRTSGATESSFQMVNLQFSGQIPFSRYSSANANLTVQKTRQHVQLTPEQQALEAELLLLDPFRRPLFENSGDWRTNTSGGASFSNARLFGVPRLRYTANLTIYNAQLNTRLAGDLNAPRENVAWTHEQRLDYAIGRIDLRLTFRLAEVDGKKNALLFLRLSRGFGAF